MAKNPASFGAGMRAVTPTPLMQMFSGICGPAAGPYCVDAARRGSVLHLD
jgi:hypothetical protein